MRLGKNSVFISGDACFTEIYGVAAAIMMHGCWHEAPLGKMGIFAFQMHMQLRCRARALWDGPWGGAGRGTGEHYITYDTYLDGIRFLLLSFFFFGSHWLVVRAPECMPLLLPVCLCAVNTETLNTWKRERQAKNIRIPPSLYPFGSRCFLAVFVLRGWLSSVDGPDEDETILPVRTSVCLFLRCDTRTVHERHGARSYREDGEGSRRPLSCCPSRIIYSWGACSICSLVAWHWTRRRHQKFVPGLNIGACCLVGAVLLLPE